MVYAWNFKDPTFLSLFILAIVIALLFIFFIASLGVINSVDKKYRNKIKQESNTTRIFIIDVKKNLVTYFNRSDLRTKRTMDFAAFYARFHPNDIEKVKNWIFSICVDYKSVEQYLEADVVIHRGKSSYFSLLKFLHYDSSIGLIHLESHILRYITPTNMTSKLNGKKHAIGVVKRSVMTNQINTMKSINGYTFCIRFFYMKQKALTNEKIERYMAMTLKNEIYPYASINRRPRQIIESTDNELFLCDLHITNNDDAMQLANSIAHSLNKAIKVNGFQGTIDFSIGVIQNFAFYHDFDEIIFHAQETCISAHQNDKSVALYQKTISSEQDFSKYEDEINALLKQGSIRYLYRPIVDAKRKKILGYFVYVKAYDSSFASFNEIARYASRIGKNREIFARVSKMIIPKFANEKPDANCRLFFPVGMMDIDNLIDIVPQMNAFKDTKLVVVFDEQEVNENALRVDLFNEKMQSLHKLDFELALLMKDKNLLLDPSIYTNFDFFVAGSSMTGEIKKNSRIRLSIHTLVEQLLKYKKPIIATDMEGWASIELIIKSGINLISSETIAYSNDMLLPVDKKKMEKLSQIDNNFN